MKTLNLCVVIFALSVASVSAQASRELQRDKTPTTSANRTALVIGNGSYDSAPLKNPPNDANDIAGALKSLGFEVMSYTNLDQTGMKRAIREFGTKLRAKGGVGLFYYAGHGVQVKGTNYLVPIGAKVNTEEEVEYESVEAGLAIAQMESAKNELNIVILDACRNNPFARSMRSADKGLASIDAPSGTLIAYSTAPGSVASDGSGRNGLYTQELLKYMRAPGASIEEVFKRVRVSVRGATTGQQTPWESSSLTGDFYFAANRAAAQAEAPSPKVETSSPEESTEATFWRSIENSTDAKDFENYLTRSASGEFAGTYKSAAELKLAGLKKTVNFALWAKLGTKAAALRKYGMVYPFKDGRASFCTDGKCGYLDESGTEVIPAIYDLPFEFRDGIAMAMVGPLASGTARFGYIDTSGRVVIPVRYNTGGNFSEGLAGVSVDGKFGFIDRTGHEVISLKYSFASDFADGLAAVANKDFKWGYIDKTGSLVIPFKYSSAMPFSEGLAAVGITVNGETKYGFIDKSGREVIAPKYDFAYKFEDGLASFAYNLGGKMSWGLMDKSGREVLPAKYEEVSSYGGQIYAKSGGKYGWLDKSGSEVIPFKYEKIWCWTFYKEGLFGVVLNGKKGFVDAKGNEYFDF